MIECGVDSWEGVLHTCGMGMGMGMGMSMAGGTGSLHKGGRMTGGRFPYCYLSWLWVWFFVDHRSEMLWVWNW